ncbi:MAG TPA: alpha/beta fold hydrolase [Chitinophagaceae bacterium]|nr:alpha/beta fold hydrolase [Chitinophagaceae bacterium]
MMRRITAFTLSLLSVILTTQTTAQSRTIDTLINVGSYSLHFVIVEGKGTPILFEAGGGDDASAWKNILQPVSQITGAPLVTYDRPGFGKSGLDTITHGIIPNIQGLETALTKLGFGGNVMYVAHSQGGIYAQVFAYRHPTRVKTAVLVDATTACFYQPARLAATQQSINQGNDKIRYTHPGIYFQGADFSNNIEVVRRSPFPSTIPVIDFVSDNPPFSDSIDIADWKRCHREFVAAAANRTGFTAWGCGHYIFEDNPPLVITAIAKAYAGIAGKSEAAKINNRTVNYTLQAANEFKKQETAYRHSEDDINSWGYELMQAGDIKKAMEVFKLNIFLHPSNWNVYDSYGDALLKNGDKTEAAKMYRKSLELNPGNKHAAKALNNLSSN